MDFAFHSSMLILQWVVIHAVANSSNGQFQPISLYMKAQNAMEFGRDLNLYSRSSIIWTSIIRILSYPNCIIWNPQLQWIHIYIFTAVFLNIYLMLKIACKVMSKGTSKKWKRILKIRWVYRKRNFICKRYAKN